MLARKLDAKHWQHCNFPTQFPQPRPQPNQYTPTHRRTHIPALNTHLQRSWKVSYNRCIACYDPALRITSSRETSWGFECKNTCADLEPQTFRLTTLLCTAFQLSNTVTLDNCMIPFPTSVNWYMKIWLRKKVGVKPQHNNITFKQDGSQPWLSVAHPAVLTPTPELISFANLTSHCALCLSWHQYSLTHNLQSSSIHEDSWSPITLITSELSKVSWVPKITQAHVERSKVKSSWSRNQQAHSHKQVHRMSPLRPVDTPHWQLLRKRKTWLGVPFTHRIPVYI